MAAFPAPHRACDGAAGGSEALAQPLEVRGHVFVNRLVVAPMCTNYAAPDGGATERLVAYYRARGCGGAALVITEIAFIDDLGSRGFQAQLGAHSDRMIPGLGDIADAIREGGALAGLQIGHCGSQRGLEPPILAPSPIAWAVDKPVPRVLTSAEIADIITAFAEAARRAARAGFDLVEVHAAHGYLVNAFLSPALNKRRDRYGGSAENRLRFAIDVAGAIRDAIGPGRLLSFRINGDDLMPEGLTVREYQGIAGALVDAGVDLLHVSAGTYRAMARRVTTIYAEEGPFVDQARAIKAAVQVPVIASDTIHDPALAERIIGDGIADLVSMARPMFADPELPRKVLAGRFEAAVPCIRCNTCVAREQKGLRAHCAVNPTTGREGERAMPAARPRQLLVVGGGPAGIQCAITAASRGHAVTLAERSQRLGGQIALAAELDFKAPLRRLCAYYRQALARAGVDVRLGTAVEPSSPLLADKDAVIWATGPSWEPPAWAARDSAAVLDPMSAFEKEAALGQTAVVIGATMIGAELAWHLTRRGHDAVLLERRSDFAEDVNLIYRAVLRDELARAGVEVAFSTGALAVEDGEVLARTGDAERRWSADAVIAACGARAADSRRAPASSNGAETHWIGECAGQFGLMAAVHGGYAIAQRL